MQREICFEFMYSNGGKFLKANATLNELCDNNAPNDYMYEKALENYEDYQGIENFDLVAKRQLSEYKDKKDNDIIEGDIVVLNETKDNCYEENQQIVFMDGAFYVGVANGSFVELLSEVRYFWHRRKKYNGIEVIGNIYETPELLKSHD